MTGQHGAPPPGRRPVDIPGGSAGDAVARAGPRRATTRPRARTRPPGPAPRPGTAEDAAYHTEPHSQPWRGREEIVRRWLDRKDQPGDTEFRWHPLTVTPEVAVVEGTTTYRDPPRTTATCGSSAWTPTAAAPSSPSG